MKRTLFLACEPGTAPDVTRELELKGFRGLPRTTETTVELDCTTHDLIKAAYLLQTPTRICMGLSASLEIDPTLEGMAAHLHLATGVLNYKELLTKEQSFHVHCERSGDQEYNSVDLSQETGKQIKRYAREDAGFVPAVHLKKPDVLFYLHVTRAKAWLALDLLGKPADKRSYKVFNNPHSIKGTTAACLLMAGGWQPGKALLDPYTSGGVIPIEAALLAANRSLHFYDKDLACRRYRLFKEADDVIESLDGQQRPVAENAINAFDAQLRNVTAAKKNAKIAGVDKRITFSKLDVEWIDTKLTAKSVDCIVTQPVEASKHVPEAKAKELHKRLFYQADFVLKESGTMTFLCQRPEDLKQA
ncbi:hypothetical protein GF367_03500, partial [Candidatus Woesearchaeota archaeon]|nr:hypothetical protein [Candidatus Woesearchaeota archaeon]